MLSETPALEQTYWASALVRAGLRDGSAIYYEATLGKLLTLPHLVSLYVNGKESYVVGGLYAHVNLEHLIGPTVSSVHVCY